MGLHAYHNSSWGVDAQPFGGHVIMMCNGAIQWSAKKIKSIPDSTAEAETIVASRAAKDTVGVRLVLEDLGAQVQGPTILITDCKASRDVIIKPGSTQRTKYFERTTLFVKRLYTSGEPSPR